MKTHTVFPAHRNVGLNPLANLVLLRLLLVTATCSLAVSSLAATRYWTGNGGVVSNVFKIWSNPNNWTPVGVPQNGEDLRFLSIFSADVIMLNDLTNLTVRSLDFGISDLGDAEVHLYGYPLGISHGISNTYDFECQVYIHCGVKLEGQATFVTGNTQTLPFYFGEDVTMHFLGPIDLNGRDLVLFADAAEVSAFVFSSGRMYIKGGITGVGNVTAIAGRRSHLEFYNYEGSIEFRDVGNDFTGTFTLNCIPGSEIRLNVYSGEVANNLIVLPNSGNTRFARANQFGDGATVRLLNGGRLNLNGHNDTIQHLDLLNDTLDSQPSTLTTGSGTLTVLGNITSANYHVSVEPTIQGQLSLGEGNHDLHVSGTRYVGLDIQARMSGFGNFTKSGNAALLLQGSNSFNSGILINEGLIDVRHNYGLGDIAGSTALTGGGLVLRNVAIGEELLFALGHSTGGELPGSSLTVVGSSSWAGQVVLYTNLVIVGGDMTFTGPISETGGLGCFSGGTIRLGGTLANTYTGPTLVRSALVEFAKPSGVKAYNGPLIVGGASGGPHEARWLNSYQNVQANVTIFANGTINLNNFNEDFGPLTFTGGHITTGTGELGIYGLVTVNPINATASIAGKLGLPSGYREFRVADGSANPDLLVTATVLGPGNLHKTGLGQMTLTGVNTYNGLTLLEAGTLTVGHPSGLGSTASGTIVLDGTTLAFSFLNGPVAETISLRGAGVGGTNGALNVAGTAHLRNQFPSIFAALDLTTNATIRVESGGRLTTDGFVSGTGPLTKTGFGSLVFSNSNPNFYVGDTLVKEGTLELRKPSNVIAVPGHLTVGPATVGSPATTRWYQTGAMPVDGIATINANSLLDLNGNNQTLQRLNLNDGGDAATGAGTLSFRSGGLVAVGSLFGPGPAASATFSGRIGLPANETLTFAVTAYAPGLPVGAPELEVSALIPAPVENVNFERAGIYKSGGGELRLTGNNTFNGRVDVVAGTLTVGNATALGTSFDSTFIENGASLALINGIIINNESLRLNSTNPAALDNRGGHNTWFGPVIQARDSGIWVNQDWSLTVQGTISGTGSLTKWGGGLLRLGGAANNTHSGNTYVDAGTLFLTKAPNIQAVPANLIIGRPEGGVSATVMHVNSDLIWGDVTVNHGGLLNVNGYTEYISNLTLNGGAAVQTGFGSLYVVGANGITVHPNGSNPATITGQLGFNAGARSITVGSGTTTPGAHDLEISATIFQANPTVNLTKAGAGRARFSGNNTYTGTTTVSGGQLQIDGNQPQSPVQVFGARLQGSGTVGHVTFGGSTAMRFAPGASPGILTTSNFNANALGGGQVEIELNGPTVGSGYDQINVRGSVNLTGLTLSPTLNFASADNDQFTIINNDGADAVIGTFTGLPQGAELYIGSEQFQISYTGGTGNDVVLTRLVTPPPPTLTIERVPPSSVRLIWPTNDPAFRLQSTTNLTALTWISASPPPVVIVIGTNNVLTNTISGAQQYYRLINP
jgi:autotransporter-associated beta strand protein